MRRFSARIKENDHALESFLRPDKYIEIYRVAW